MTTQNDDADLRAFEERLAELPDGYFVAGYRGSRYGVTKSRFNAGSSLKLEARELGGKDYISLNAYTLSGGKFVLKPCEMSDTKVVLFVTGLEILNSQ